MMQIRQISQKIGKLSGYGVLHVSGVRTVHPITSYGGIFKMNMIWVLYIPHCAHDFQSVHWVNSEGISGYRLFVILRLKALKFKKEGSWVYSAWVSYNWFWWGVISTPVSILGCIVYLPSLPVLSAVVAQSFIADENFHQHLESREWMRSFR